MKLQWSETATRDLISIRRYIAEDNPTAAKKWIDRLRDQGWKYRACSLVRPEGA